MIDTTMLPRPLRDHKVLGVIRALDEEHRMSKRAGMVGIEIHYNTNGFPSKVKVKGSDLEIQLDETSQFA